SAIPPLFALWPKLRSLGILRLERKTLAVLFFAAGYGVAYALTLVLPEASELRDAIKALLAPVRGG
ncbi:MAG: hypothetical protein AB7P00_38490, partial [Sandaracinaceae bacterium]